MNILIPDSWLRDFLHTKATPTQIQEALSLCSASVDRLHKVGDEFVYDIEVTTNRVDLMSVVGIAQEAAAVLPQFGHTAKLRSHPLTSETQLKTSSQVKYLNVNLDSKLCQRFSAVLIRNVSVKPSPAKITNRLELVGMRGLNNVIDISNYLMQELGQPVHTFDYDKIAGHKMILRESNKGEKITTLDHKTHTLSGGDIVIEDGEGRLIDLCGIMGGLNSSVDEKTKNILLFVQTYEPSRIRRTSMALAHRTPAAVLFEKGLPVENVIPTLEEGIKLFSDLTGGKPDKEFLDIMPAKSPATSIKLIGSLTDFANDRLGINLTSRQINQILTSLDFQVKSERDIVVPPTRRLDVTIPEDLVEEIARIYGYHNLPSQLMSGGLPTQRPDDKTFYWEQRIKNTLKHWGFTETYTYSLVARSLEPDPHALRLKNPLTRDWEYLRTSLTSSHLSVVSENMGRVKELNLFEIANVYLPRKKGLPGEQLRLVLTTTNSNPLYLKGIIEGLGLETGASIPTSNLNSHIQPPCNTIELNLDEVISRAKTVKPYHPISKFSPVIEDVNVTQNESESYADLVAKIKNTSSLIKSVNLVDKYESKLTLRITYHSNSKQLSTEDIAPLRNIILSG